MTNANLTLQARLKCILKWRSGLCKGAPVSPGTPSLSPHLICSTPSQHVPAVIVVTKRGVVPLAMIQPPIPSETQHVEAVWVDGRQPDLPPVVSFALVVLAVPVRLGAAATTSGTRVPAGVEKGGAGVKCLVH